ncbi:PREDICTED: testis-expressed sequence 12 protein [Bison bison bison]|uniref:Testis-expressed sequence 12 protein n=1 Tax=Bison bison bison TaxID=43346 RepID=A0A6P3GGD3_BISBB|nr:PREDICTED: testis-expressed sequence 12 protein [Bison bison bison]XP_010828632.1 PREDICTED: testis-expressed sequence 12 protein [Bison bison bison]
MKSTKLNIKNGIFKKTIIPKVCLHQRKGDKHWGSERSFGSRRLQAERPAGKNPRSVEAAWACHVICALPDGKANAADSSFPRFGLGGSSCLQNMMASQLVKPDTRNCKRPRELEPQMPDSPQLSSLGKSDSSLSESSGLFYKDEALEKDLNDMSKEINLMLSTYAKILSERAAVDASYIDEIDGLFKEANTIENFLIQKRELLRQRLTVIANTLHR